MTDRKLREKAEALLAQSEGVMPEETYNSLTEVMEELQVYQAELIIQNDELRNTQERLTELSHRYKELFDRVPAPCLVLDQQGVIRETNWALEHLLDRPRTRLIGKPLMLFVVPESQQAVSYHRLQTLEQEKSHTVDVDLKNESGRIYHVRMDSGVIVEEGERLCLSTLVDLTLIRNAEKAQAEACHQTERLLKNQSDFVANINHELRTPLTAVLTAAQILSESEVTSEQKDLLQMVERSAEQLHYLIDNLLQMQQNALYQDAPAATPIDLTTMVNDIFMANRASAENKVTLEADISEAVPSPLFGVAEVLRQVLTNLIDNAVKFTDQGRVQVRITYKATAADGQLMIEVEDTGIGMAPSFQARAFERFSQVDPGSSASKRGMGLGLRICRDLLDQIGGAIELESELGRGSLFRVHFPVLTEKTLPTAPRSSFS